MGVTGKRKPNKEGFLRVIVRFQKDITLQLFPSYLPFVLGYYRTSLSLPHKKAQVHVLLYL